MIKKASQRLGNERGLTLVELLAVIVILSIVGTIAFVYVGGIIENIRKDAHIANAQQVINAAKMYQAADGDINDGVTVDQLTSAGFLENILDPWNRNKTYGGEAVITKEEDGEFAITGFNSSGCTFGDKAVLESDLHTEDRDTLCK